MKANGLNGDYCQNCTAILDDVQRNHRRVIVLDSQCVAVFHQSGDFNLLDDRIVRKTEPAPQVSADKPEKPVEEKKSPVKKKK